MSLSLPSRAARRALVAPVVALALLGLTSCGDDEAPTLTATDSSSALSPGDEISPADFAELVGDAFDQASTAQVKLTAGDKEGLSGDGVVDFAGDNMNAALTVDVAALGGSAEVRLVDNVAYLKVPMLGEKFIKADLDDPTNALGKMLPRELDLGQLFAGMEKGIKEATYVGEDDVDGEAMDHYAVVVDPAKLVDAPEAEKLDTAKTIDFDIWFDSEGFVRRLTTEAPAPVGSLDLTLSGWGEDVTIEAPPADQVTSLPSFGLAG